MNRKFQYAQLMKKKYFSKQYFIFFFILFIFYKMTSGEKTESLFLESDSCREFSSKLYKISTKNIEGNVVLSPISVHIILSCLCHGAYGKTASEMIDGLFIKNLEKLHIGYKNLLTAFNSANEGELRLANAIFVHENVQLLDTFSMLGKEYYNFSISNINFKNNIKSAAFINNWVKEKTNDKIIEIVESADIGNDTSAILVNAIHFKGTWEYTFNPKYTADRAFYVTKDIQKRISMMKNKEHYVHGELSDLESKFIEIPYKNENLSMLIILPNESSDLSFLEEKFNWDVVKNAKTTRQEVTLYLPKFKIECTLNLEEILRKMGFNSMFDNTADFSGVTETPVRVSKVVQKVFIETNELGTEAAAASMVQMRLRRALIEPEEFIVDRPFMVIIRHNPSDIPLFIGNVRDIGVSVQKDEL